MAQTGPYVKPERNGFLRWIDRHPRVGWYIVGLQALNTLLLALDLVK